MFRTLFLLWLCVGFSQAATRLIPHVTSSTGGFDTRFTITNLGLGPRAYTLTAYDLSGSATMVVSGTIAAGKTLVRDRATLFNQFPVSHLAVAGADIHVTASFRAEGTGTPAELHETVAASRHLRLLPGNTDLAWDGIAVVNLGETAAAVEVRQVNSEGEVLNRLQPATLQQIAPNGKGLFVFNHEFFPVPDSVFEIVSDQPMAVAALRGSGDSAYLWRTETIDLASRDIAAPVAVTLESATFTAASGEQVMAELGTFRVKENRLNPLSRFLSLQFVRLPATTATPTEPIIYLAGGPGGSAVSAAEGPRFAAFQRMRAVADVILLEQRGAGLSNDVPAAALWIQPPPDQVLTEAGYANAVASAFSAARAAWQAQGIDLEGYTTEQNARDVDALRRALGAEKVWLWGTSYGTHLALATARLFPERVAGLILAGCEGPDDTLKLPAETDQLLMELETALLADDASAALYPDFPEALQRVLAKLAEAPVAVTAVNPISGVNETLQIGVFDVQLLVAGALADRNTLALLPWAVAVMDAGGYQALGDFFQQVRVADVNGPALHIDIAGGASWARRRLVRAQADAALLGNAVNGPFHGLMEADLVTPAPFALRLPLQSELPVLFIGGSLDGRTPLAQQYAVAEGFAQARHLVLENGTHGDDLFVGDAAIADIMAAFVVGNLNEDRRLVLPLPDFVNAPASLFGKVHPAEKK